MFERSNPILEDQGEFSPGSAGKLSRITGYIQENYQKSLSLKELSFLFSIRPDSLSRRFKKEIGIGLPFFICLIRVEMAKQLLLDPSHRIKDICYHVGFSSPQAFCKVFKKVTKLSPRAYRKYISQCISQ